MLRLPLTNRPRESLFDALNIEPYKGVFIGWKDPTYTPGPAECYIAWDFEGVTQTENVPKAGIYSDQLTFEVVYAGSGYTVDALITYDDGTSETVEIKNVDTAGGKRVISVLIDTSSIHIYGGTKTVNVTTLAGYNGLFDCLAKVMEREYFNVFMDVDYLTNHSGTKAVSNSVLMYLEKYGRDAESIEPCVPIKTLNQQGIFELAGVIWLRFGDSWDKIYNALVAEYEPLENYSMHEETAPDLTDEFGVSNDYSKSRDRSVNTNVDTETGIYGFNSATAVPSGTGNTTGTALDNTENETETQTGKRIETHKGKTTVDRNGNIGVTTSQQMLESEIQVRIKNHMDEIIYNDVDQVLTTAGYRPIYSSTINII